MPTRNKISPFNYIAIGICVIDAHYQIQCWNHALEVLTDIKMEDAVGRYLYDFYPDFQKTINKMRISDVVNGGAPSIFTSSLNKSLFAPKKRLQSVFYYDILASHFPLENDENGALFSVIDRSNLYRKIVEFKKTKDQALKEVEYRKTVEKTLKHENESKDKFISIMAHDIRNPLGVIQGVSDFLIKSYGDLDKEEVLDFLEGINNSSKTLNDLITDLLTWARSQRNNIELNLADNNLYDLVNEDIRLLAQPAKSKSITVQNNIAKDTIIPFDRNMLSTVIRNLISNAIKFTYNGGNIFIECQEKGNYFEVSIKDDGIGIKPEDMQKLFLIGESKSTKGTNNESGTGLGLILCKEFIKNHKGEIWVESELGKGSTFKFTIPISIS
ncbi:MAG TPA: ATP-binding protein [Candidatus Kapabacteria bacterium]|nr:ATP-binding protein [Candidatus Kapabacteria bacterium]